MSPGGACASVHALRCSPSAAVQILEQLCEGEALPWSDERLPPGQRSRLGFCCEPVRQLLARDPRRRMPLADFEAFCSRMLSITPSTSASDPFAT